MKEVIYVNEEQLFLTREEAEYSRFVSLLTSRAAAGTDIGNKANVLMSRLDAELSKPDECQISMTAEDKNILSVVFMVYELFRRCKYDDINVVVNTINGFGCGEMWQDASPIWYRPQYYEGRLYKPRKLLQVVGHTPVEGITRKGNLISCDVFSTDSVGKPIGTQEFPVIDTVAWEYQSIR